MKIRKYDKFTKQLRDVIVDVVKVAIVNIYDKIENLKYYEYGVGKLERVIEIRRSNDIKMYLTIEDNSICLWEDTGKNFHIVDCVVFGLYTTKESVFCATIIKLKEYGLV